MVAPDYYRRNRLRSIRRPIGRGDRPAAHFRVGNTEGRRDRYGGLYGINRRRYYMHDVSDTATNPKVWRTVFINRSGVVWRWNNRILNFNALLALIWSIILHGRGRRDKRVYQEHVGPKRNAG